MLGRTLTRGLIARNAILKTQKRTLVLPPARRAPFMRLSLLRPDEVGSAFEIYPLKNVKLLVGGSMCASSLIIPGWVIANLKHYNGSINAPEEEELEDD